MSTEQVAAARSTEKLKRTSRRKPKARVKLGIDIPLMSRRDRIARRKKLRKYYARLKRQ